MPVLAVGSCFNFSNPFSCRWSNNLVPLLPKAEEQQLKLVSLQTPHGETKRFSQALFTTLAAGATLTISGKVSNNGEINVYGTIDVSGSNGQLLVNKQGKEQGTVNIHSGGTLNIDAYLRVDGLVGCQPWWHT